MVWCELFGRRFVMQSEIHLEWFYHFNMVRYAKRTSANSLAHRFNQLQGVLIFSYTGDWIEWCFSSRSRASQRHWMWITNRSINHSLHENHWLNHGKSSGILRFRIAVCSHMPIVLQVHSTGLQWSKITHPISENIRILNGFLCFSD